MDPDGREIKKHKLDSIDVSKFIAADGSYGIALDGKGNLAAYLKLDLGFGYGVDLKDISKAIGVLDDIVDIVNIIKDIESIIDLIGPVSDEGENMDFDLLWDTIDVRGAWLGDSKTGDFFPPITISAILGLTVDEEKKIEPTLSTEFEISVYFAELTIYFKIAELEVAE